MNITNKEIAIITLRVFMTVGFFVLLTEVLKLLTKVSEELLIVMLLVCTYKLFIFSTDGLIDYVGKLKEDQHERHV